jgi:hypothetical protein
MKQIEPDFNFFLPIDFEKAQNKKGEKVMKIKGIASTDDKDSEGEILDPMGFDLSRFLTGGFLNWNHQSKTMGAGAIIGEPTLAKVTSKGELYVEGLLYSGHPLAESVWNLAETLEKNNSKRKLGFSIEGRATERDIMNPKKITKALLTGLAVTHVPVNTNTYLDLVKGIQSEDFVENKDQDILEKAENSDLLYEFTNNNRRYGITKGFDVVDIEKKEETREDRVAKIMSEFREGNLKVDGRVVTDKDEAMKIALEKCMDVAATQPLVPESLDKKPKVLEPNLKKAILMGIVPIDRIEKSKGRRANIGEIRDFSGKKFQKQSNGTWKPVESNKEDKERESLQEEYELLLEKKAVQYLKEKEEKRLKELTAKLNKK